MATRAKPAACCALRAVKPLPKGKLERLSLTAKAIADPNRIEILRLVAQQSGPVCACDVVEHLNLSQPTVSHHLKILKQARLLRGSRSGLWAFYEIELDGVRVLKDLTRMFEQPEAH